MWDNTALLRSLANTLIVFSVLAVLYGALHYAVHQPGALPLRSVRLDAAPQRVTAEEVQAVVRSELQGNLFTVDIERLRQSLEKLPWVRSVSIRREFPEQLAVSLEEHRALARWNGAALVNTYGEVFRADSEQSLPDFTGQEGTSAEVAQRYAEFSRQLAGLNLQVAQLALTPRHAWRMKLGNGLVVELGHEEMQQRLARFVAAYPRSLAVWTGPVRYVDLRYRNGFAVGGMNKG